MSECAGLTSAIRWAVRWRNVGLDPCEHIMYVDSMPVLFRTRAEARTWIEKEYGYIRGRKDLRNYPHVWKMPKPIKAKVIEVVE